MSVSAIIVTRGDVDLAPIVSSLPVEWELIVWVNNGGVLVWPSGTDESHLRQTHSAESDLSVYGRYAAIQYASHDLIYVQDDDCIVSDPQAIVDVYEQARDYDGVEGRVADPRGFLVANMPQEFRPHYLDSCLVGFGACFHRDLPYKAFQQFYENGGATDEMLVERERIVQGDPESGGFWMEYEPPALLSPLFHRTCDVVFTTLTPRVLVDVPVEVLPYAHDSNRMWKQPDHFGERTRVLEMARKVRDA